MGAAAPSSWAEIRFTPVKFQKNKRHIRQKVYRHIRQKVYSTLNLTSSFAHDW